MSGPRILIVDDEAPARARLAALLGDIAAGCPHQLVGEAGDAASAIEAVRTLQPDLILLDVQMPGMNGIELAAELQALTPAAVIFVTAFEHHALQAFEVQALDYLLKPVRAARLAEAVARCVPRRMPPAARRSHFSIAERERTLRVPLDEVLYLKAEMKYVTVRTATHAYLMEESLSALEEEFPDLFLRVHRNALVARAAVEGVERAEQVEEGEKEGWQVILRGLEERLPISRRQWPAVRALLR